jgi:hypothetical protein
MMTTCPKCGKPYETTTRNASHSDRECGTCWAAGMNKRLQNQRVVRQLAGLDKSLPPLPDSSLPF